MLVTGNLESTYSKLYCVPGELNTMVNIKIYPSKVTGI